MIEVLRGRVIYIETRNLSDYSVFKEAFAGQSWKYLPYYNFKLRTDDDRVMTKAVSESRMRQIKKAIRSGVTWRPALNLNEVECFYGILAGLYRSKIGKPLLPWDFFSGAFEKGFGIYLLVFFDNEIIGGTMCPVLEKKVLYEFYVCGLDKEYKDQYPSVMATWAAMVYANKNNIPVFDFMGAGRSKAEYGVRDFKARFGGDLVEFGRFQRIFRPLLYSLGKAALKMLSFRKA
jgi:lipid II:glycine glycyltransferase (peptidoglycan interpeptide bridge formation enzyme)